MPSASYLPEVLETTEAEQLATGSIFTEGPTRHPNGYLYLLICVRTRCQIAAR
jgi:hypothetical protein